MARRFVSFLQARTDALRGSCAPRAVWNAELVQGRDRLCRDMSREHVPCETGTLFTEFNALAMAPDALAVATANGNFYCDVVNEGDHWNSETAVDRAPICPCPTWKRAFDVTVTLAVLVLASPLFAAIAVWIKFVSRGPVFFRQQRYGLGGRTFMVWKFRTMERTAASEQHTACVQELMETDGPLTKRDRDLVIIAGGKTLRRLGLDELPQLINVLKGEMSLVGPRPDVVPLEKYEAWQRDRFHVLPGITGLWQVSGKNMTSFRTMMQLDVTYTRQRSMWLDLKILLLTIPAVLLE
jgi:exopolysaccharide production protein ExoY